MLLKRGRAAVLLPLLLCPALGWAAAPTTRQETAEDDALLLEPAHPSQGSASTPPAPIAPGQRRGYLLRLEATTLALLPGHGAGAAEGFIQLEPTLVLDGGEELGLSLGALVRMRAWGGVDGAGLVRKEDRDAYAEAFTSDVLGARLMGAEVEVDMEHVLSGRPRQPGRSTLALSAVPDWGSAGGAARPVTLAHLDGTAVVRVRRNKAFAFEAQLFAGWGGRPGPWP